MSKSLIKEIKKIELMTYAGSGPYIEMNIENPDSFNQLKKESFFNHGCS